MIIVINFIYGEIMSFHHSVPNVMTNSDQFFVRLCGCGVVHMSFGCTVVNLSPEAAVAISETLREVTDSLKIEMRKRMVNSLLTDKTEPLEAQLVTESALPKNVISGRFPQPPSKA